MIDLNDVLLAMSNIPVDDPIAEIWGRGLQSGYKIIEYTGSLPIAINANGDVLIDYRIYGSDSGVGETTENLWDNYFANGTYEPGGFRPNSFHICGVEKIPIKSGTQYSISYVSTYPYPIDRQYLYEFDTQGERLRQRAFNDKSFTTSSDAAFCTISVGSTTAGIKPDDISDFMLVEGSTAPANYIPYGYKLPMMVSDGNTVQSVPVYIGENQLDSVEGGADYVDKASGKIVRMIGEYTFTGDENFSKYGSSDVFYTSKTIDPVGITTVNTTTMRCDHPAFTVIENKDTRYWLNPEADDVCCFLPGGMSQVFLRSTSNFATVAECKAYLKTQYDNGTPVKISYWLKTPIEEAPPVPFPEIPTIEGETIIDYDGEPKPSQMYIKYKDKE